MSFNRKRSDSSSSESETGNLLADPNFLDVEDDDAMKKRKAKLDPLRSRCAVPPIEGNLTSPFSQHAKKKLSEQILRQRLHEQMGKKLASFNKYAPTFRTKFRLDELQPSTPGNMAEYARKHLGDDVLPQVISGKVGTVVWPSWTTWCVVGCIGGVGNVVTDSIDVYYYKTESMAGEHYTRCVAVLDGHKWIMRQLYAVHVNSQLHSKQVKANKTVVENYKSVMTALIANQATIEADGRHDYESLTHFVIVGAPHNSPSESQSHVTVRGYIDDAPAITIHVKFSRRWNVKEVRTFRGGLALTASDLDFVWPPIALDCSPAPTQISFI
ncbi:hypothetical protein PLEOSDRAFT_1085459 [Pleurotus ostreatus PC15]|uniref:Uncharacterized protein n=1 Tax=Pleurotus ostreatus (strain PC15) TaxID=1137138 RepID=A0A067NRK3_PLEO1|nr:hypothetical protein PLEOSDRAFT_1085459 [Pleurotus ostreatus PC15]